MPQSIIVKQNTPFLLYVSNSFQNQNNTCYPKSTSIKSIEDLREAVKRDHIFGKMENGFRSKEKWQESNCLYADIDNTHSENETDWKTKEDFIKDFADYEFYLIASKSNQIEKDGMKARPKFHIYFPIGTNITNRQQFESYLIKLTGHYHYFDNAVKDASRFFYGIDVNTEKYFDYYNGGKSIITLLDSIDIPSIHKKQNENTNSIIKNGERNKTLFTIARKLFNSGKNDNEVMETLHNHNISKCETPLEDKELETIVNSAQKYVNKRYVENGITYIDNKDIAIQFINEKGFIRIIKNGDIKIIDTNSITEYNQKSFITLHSTYLTTFDSLSKNIGKWFVSLPIEDSDLPVYNMVFNPTLPHGKNDNSIYNTYKGFSVEPINEGDCSLIYRHLLEVWANNNEEIYNYILNWIAHLFQKPYEKPEIAIGIRSEEGTGKGIIIEQLLGSIIGEHFVPTTDTSIINNRFNKELERCLLFNLNEVGWIDKNQTGVLKSWITDKRTKIEGKGTNAEYIDTFFRVIFSTNCDRIVETKSGQRRWIMLNPSSCYKDDNNYFKLLSECICKSKGKFLYDMLHRDINEFNPRQIPETEETKQQIELSKNSAENFIDDILNGYLENDLMPDNTTISKSRLYLIYTDYCNVNGYCPFNNKHFGAIINNRYSDYFTEIRNKNERLWNITR